MAVQSDLSVKFLPAKALACLAKADYWQDQIDTIHTIANHLRTANYADLRFGSNPLISDLQDAIAYEHRQAIHHITHYLKEQ